MSKISAVKSLLRFDLLMVLVILFVPLLVFSNIALKVILLTLIVLFSRSTSLYDNLKIEIHSVMILASATVFGPFPGIFAALATAPLINIVGRYLGCFQKPPWIMLDTICLAIAAYIASFLSPESLATFGIFIIIIFENGIVGGVRIYLFNDPMMRRFMLSVVNIMFSYLILKNFLPQIINWLH